MFPSEVVVNNGYIIHDDAKLLEPFYRALSKSKLPFFLTKVNHAMVTPGVWQMMWDIRKIMLWNFTIALSTWEQLLK